MRNTKVYFVMYFAACDVQRDERSTIVQTLKSIICQVLTETHAQVGQLATSGKEMYIHTVSV